MKRPHDHSNYYKGKHFIGAGLQFQRSSPLNHGGKHGVCVDRHGAGDGADPKAAEGDCVPHWV